MGRSEQHLGEEDRLRLSNHSLLHDLGDALRNELIEKFHVEHVDAGDHGRHASRGWKKTISTPSSSITATSRRRFYESVIRILVQRLRAKNAELDLITIG